MHATSPARDSAGAHADHRRPANGPIGGVRSQRANHTTLLSIHDEDLTVTQPLEDQTAFVQMPEHLGDEERLGMSLSRLGII